MRNLCGQWRGNCLEVERLGSIMDWHLPSLAQIQVIAEALVHAICYCESAKMNIKEESGQGKIESRGGGGELHVKDRTYLPSPHEHSNFSVLSKDNVIHIEYRGTADVGCLFAKAGHVK